MVRYMLLSLHGQDEDALAKTKAARGNMTLWRLFYKCNVTDIMAATSPGPAAPIWDSWPTGYLVEQYHRAARDPAARHLTEDGRSSCSCVYLTELEGKTLSPQRNAIH